MPEAVSQIGTYRCQPVDTGVAKTQEKGYPQFKIQARLLEIWDADEKVWVPWEEAEQEVTVYAVLFGQVGKPKKLGPTLTHKQVCKVFDWDGNSFTYLNDTDFSDVKFQVRIEDNDPKYADKTPFQVNWIDVYDAEPGNKIKKLDAAGVKELDQHFALLLKQTGTKAAPVTATKPDGTIKKKDKKQTDAIKAAKIADATKAAKVKTPPKAPPKAPAPATQAPEATVKEGVGVSVGNYTKQVAWETIVEFQDESVTEEQRNAAWHAAIAEVAPDTDEKDITPEQWFTIKDKVLDEVGKF